VVIPFFFGQLLDHLFGSLKSPLDNHGPRTQVILQALGAFIVRAIDVKKVANLIIQPDTGNGMPVQWLSTWAILVFWRDAQIVSPAFLHGFVGQDSTLAR